MESTLEGIGRHNEILSDTQWLRDMELFLSANLVCFFCVARVWMNEKDVRKKTERKIRCLMIISFQSF